MAVSAPSRGHAPRLVLEVFRQIEDARPDLAMDRMAGAVGRMAQRDDVDVEAALFEREDLLRDESLREARIAFEDKGDAPAGGRRSGWRHALRRARTRRRSVRP